MVNLNIIAGQTTTITFTVELQTGSLKIVISGLFPGIGLNGGTVHITGPNAYNQTFTIDTTGVLDVPALIPGTYTADYVQPAGYNLL
jgi:hypothetical protein